jgi:hypothetical protein
MRYSVNHFRIMMNTLYATVVSKRVGQCSNNFTLVMVDVGRCLGHAYCFKHDVSTVEPTSQTFCFLKVNQAIYNTISE